MGPLSMRTPAGGLPAAPNDRVKAMLRAAADDEARGNLQGAENNLRLAMAFGPPGPEVKQALDRVMAKREAERRKAVTGR